MVHLWAPQCGLVSAKHLPQHTHIHTRARMCAHVLTCTHTSPHTEPPVRRTSFTLMYLSLHICFSSSPGATVLFIFLAWVLRILPFRQQQNHSAPLFYEVYQTAKYPVSLSNRSGVNVPTDLLSPRRPRVRL